MKNWIGLPDTVRSKSFSLKDDEMRGFRSGSLLTVAWRAASKKKPLIMLSTSSSNTTVNVQARYLTQKTPLVVDSYNKSMNGVDRADQYTAYNSFVRRSLKWWRKVFFWLMEVAAVNSYLLYKCTVPKPMTHREFHQSVICSLTLPNIQLVSPRAASWHYNHLRLSHSGVKERLNWHPHFMGKGQQRDCVVCSHQNIGRRPRRRTTFFCKTCTSHPPLCAIPCFKMYQW